MGDEIIDVLINLLKFKTITPNECGSFAYISKILDEFKMQEINVNGIKNALFTKEFSKDKFHLCFGAHIDVVPPGANWSSDPFNPLIKNGFVYARGAQDMKGNLAPLMCALKNIKNFKGKISLIVTSDEEGEAKFGTYEVLKYLKKNEDLPDFALVCEPTCNKFLGDSIKIGRRGSINGILKIYGKQGHVAYPENFINPVDLIANKLNKISNFNLDSGDENFSPSKIVITDINFGINKTNVVSDELVIKFNVRNSTNVDEELIKNHFKNLLDCKYDLSLSVASLPFLSNKNSKFVAKLIQSIKKNTSITPILNTKGGTSDGKYFAKFGVDVVEFGVKNDTIHSIDERVSLIEVKTLYNIYMDFLKSF